MGDFDNLTQEEKINMLIEYIEHDVGNIGKIKEFNILELSDLSEKVKGLTIHTAQLLVELIDICMNKNK
jgi:hypothetical protein